MDFSAVARSARGGEPDSRRDSAATVVGSVNACTLLDNTSGRVTKAAHESVAAVVSLVRASSIGARKRRRPQEHPPRGAPVGCAVADAGAHRWRTFDAGLQEVRAQLARHNVLSQVFQAQLLLALRSEDFTNNGGRGGVADRERHHQGAGAGALRDSGHSVQDLLGAPVEPRSGSARRPLDIHWRLHTSGLLPLSRLLEANEVSPAPFLLGHLYSDEGERGSFEEPAEDCTDTIVQDIRALVAQPASREAGGPDHQLREDAAALVSDVVKHLFDVGYRNPSAGFNDLAGAGSNTGDALSSRAARRVLDQLCCGPELFGTSSRAAGTEARWRGCLVAFDAIDPVAASAVPLEQDSAGSSKGSMHIAVDAAGVTAGGEGAPEAAGDVGVRKDDRTTAFLTRQLRVFMERSSGQSDHTQGDGTSVFAPEMAAPGDANGVLVDIMRHFSSAQFVEVLRSICRQATARAGDATGFHLHKPLLQWETLGPIVRAAATAHAQKVPPAVLVIGTELAAAAVNLAPAEDGHANRTVGCNQKQGVLLLSAALRLVAQADISLQGARQRAGEGGLYAQWVRSCFGARLPSTDGGVAQETCLAEIVHVGQEQGASEVFQDTPCLRGLEALREAMEKQRATEILMEALCLSVPRDPACVLEVHRDVLKTRLRAKFSVQIRDLVDLVVVRLSDLNGQTEARRRKGTGSDHDRSPGMGVPTDRASSHLGGDYGDPVTKEVGFFLRQFKRTGEVPVALKTAILWQPKSWASIRKILLASPGERIAMPDDSGNAVPASQGVVKEAIGRGENGLRVEVSLKYRRLLVQKLAKESLVSAKDHDNFRNAFIEYLQGQREKDPDENETPETAKATSAVARQLLLLESELDQQQQTGNRHGREGLGGVNKTKGDGAAVRERLALLLQEYLPRALVVELCMEDGDEPRCRTSPPAADGAASRQERALNSPPHRDWFARASGNLSRILEEWGRCFHAGNASRGVPVPESITLRDPSPDEVAEAILDSIHCCVAAIGVSLVHDLGSSASPPWKSSSSGDADLSKRKAGGSGIGQNQGLSAKSGTGTGEATAPLHLPAAKALRRVGEVVTIAAGVEVLGEALWQRCSSLLAGPNRLDPKQVLTLAHILASLPPTFHPKVERLLADLVAKALCPRPGGSCANPDSRSDASRCGKPSTNEKAGFAATAQVGALYLQSMLLLHEKTRTCAPEEVDDSNSPGSRVGPAGQKLHNGQMPASSEKQSLERASATGASSEASSSFGKGSVGFAPVILLDFLWWMERRLSMAQRMALEPRGGPHTAEELSGLLQLLQSVMRHPLIERELKQTFGARGGAMPPLQRLVAFEVAVSRDTDLCGPSTKRAFLEHVTLGRLVVDPADAAEGPKSSSIGTNEQEGVVSAQRQQGRVGTSNVAVEVKHVWQACAECLLRDSSLRHAAYRRVCRDTMSAEPSDVLSWESGTHPSWSDWDARSKVEGDLVDAEGVQTLLDSMLQVMEKLCSLEATARLVYNMRKRPAAGLDQTGDAHDARTLCMSSARGASVLLAEAVDLLKRPGATIGGAASSALVLITGIAIPAIGASEGRAKAIDSLRVVWEECFCKVRPLKFGAIASLTRMAFTWCGGQSDTRESGGDNQSCPVVQMLEDLPLLAAEMVRVWPRLARTLQPVIGIPSSLAGPYALGGWASHLSNLRNVGKELVLSLAGGGLESSKTGGGLQTGEAAISSTVQQTPSDKLCRVSASSRKDGRIPLGPVNDRTIGQREKVKARAKGGGQEGPPEDHQGDRRALEEGYGAYAQARCGSDAASFSKKRAPAITVLADSCEDGLREASSALPRTCAELILVVIDAAAAGLVEVPPKRSSEAATSVANPKRAKMGPTAAGVSARLDEGGCGESTLLGETHVRDTGSAVKMSRGNAFRPPPSAAWVVRVLKPLYGSGAGKRIVLSVRALLEALVNKLTFHRTCAMRKGFAGAVHSGGIAQGLAASLVVAILEYAPPLVAHMTAPTCVASSATPTAMRDRLGRSLAVLDSLRLLLEHVSPRQTDERGARLGAVLVNYASALLSLSSMRKEATEGCDLGTLANGRDWAGVVAFVHARVRAIAPEELRLMPAALAAQEVDPLLKQYF